MQTFNIIPNDDPKLKIIHVFKESDGRRTYSPAYQGENAAINALVDYNTRNGLQGYEHSINVEWNGKTYTDRKDDWVEIALYREKRESTCR